MTDTQRVVAGAEWLDRTIPGWARLVDLDTLDMAGSTTCVLGRLLGSYWNAFATDGGLIRLKDEDEAQARGFMTNPCAGLHALTPLWQDAIRARLQG